jgi:hypothetical protein
MTPLKLVLDKHVYGILLLTIQLQDQTSYVIYDLEDKAIDTVLKTPSMKVLKQQSVLDSPLIHLCRPDIKADIQHYLDTVVEVVAPDSWGIAPPVKEDPAITSTCYSPDYVPVHILVDCSHSTGVSLKELEGILKNWRSDEAVTVAALTAAALAYKAEARTYSAAIQAVAAELHINAADLYTHVTQWTSAPNTLPVQDLHMFWSMVPTAATEF